MHQNPSRKLYRSRNDKMIAGICGGLAEYFDNDATLIRLGLVILIIFTGFFPGVLVYLIAALIIPLEP